MMMVFGDEKATTAQQQPQQQQHARLVGGEEAWGKVEGNSAESVSPPLHGPPPQHTTPT